MAIATAAGDAKKRQKKNIAKKLAAISAMIKMLRAAAMV